MLLRIQIALTRDSVCMGDDVEDHTKIIDIVQPRDAYETVMNIAKNYLPSIMEHGHTWDCYLDGVKIAVINGNCNKIMLTADCPSITNGCALYFKYHSATY
ncbi:MAG TPA: hypothetical protein VFD52_01245 [Clostridia bacterium]|nr:hypothetical protein [Clostridia bacterium]